ncbi:MFS transporter [Gorillibacterium timonense]|uniref:MFS transporter n=1 Tax=Gorillibacterium timonense TaxID=1689269 RepID=UPI00071CA1A0|nr:MFS transporter [Gorillibacterium timonense]
MKPFSYPRIAVVGLGFFSISVVWQLYNSFMPLMLGDFIESKAIRGSIMGIDNLANIFLIPLIAAWSDRLQTRFGQRLPFLMIGMPIAALFLFVMPHYTNLATLIAIDIGFLLAMTLFRAPTISLMPDLTPPDKRSQANGIINLMGGIGSLFTLFVLAKLYDDNKPLPFLVGGAVLILCAVILVLSLKSLFSGGKVEEPSTTQELELQPSELQAPTQMQGEHQQPDSQHSPQAGVDSSDEAPSPRGILAGLRHVLVDRDRSALMILLAIFFWFVGYSGVEAQFTTYGVETLGLTASASTLTIGFFSLAFILFAVPSGFLAKKFGRVTLITTGICGLSLLFLLLFLIRDLTAIRGILMAGGLFWALVNIHSYPLVVSFAGPGRIGLYTGLYYFFSSVAQTVGPAFLGTFMDILGGRWMFVGSAACLLLSLVFLILARQAAVRAGSVQAAA